MVDLRAVVDTEDVHRAISHVDPVDDPVGAAEGDSLRGGQTAVCLGHCGSRLPPDTDEFVVEVK